MEKKKWYPSVHSDLFAVIQISVVIFIISAILVFCVLYFPVQYFVTDDSTREMTVAVAGFFAFGAALTATGYGIGVVLYKISFDEKGIIVQHSIFGKTSLHEISYQDIQFIQLYTRQSTVRHNPKVVIVVNENSKYEVMLKSDSEGDALMKFIPETLIKKVM